MKESNFGWMFEMEPYICEEDLDCIQPLSPEYSSKLWIEHISKRRHLMLEGEKDWTDSLHKADYNWSDDWDSNYTKGLSDFLRDQIFLHKDDTVLYFWKKEAAVETKWGVFLRNWIHFLFEEESPILFNVRTGFALKFSVHGLLFIGGKFVQHQCIGCEFNLDLWHSCLKFEVKPLIISSCRQLG